MTEDAHIEAESASVLVEPDTVPAEENAEAAEPEVAPESTEPDASEASTEPEAEILEPEASTEPEAEPTAEPAPEFAEESAPAPARIPWWPFIAYGVLWIALIAASYVLLTGAQVDIPAVRQDAYPFLVLAGLVLTLLGPTLALAVWFFTWLRREKGDRGGLLTTALLRGASITFLGVALWWGTLVLVDALRLGLV